MNNRLVENTRIIRILQRLYLLLLCLGIVLMVGTIVRVSLYTVFQCPLPIFVLGLH